MIRFEEILSELHEPTVTSNQERFRKLMKEQSDLTPIVDAYTEYKKCNQEIADSLELLDGERKGKKMDKELEETVLKVADYSNDEKQKLTRRMHLLLICGLIAAVVYLILLFTDRADNFLGGFCQGVTPGMMIVGVIMTGKYAARIRAYKKRLLAK